MCNIIEVFEGASGGQVVNLPVNFTGHGRRKAEGAKCIARGARRGLGRIKIKSKSMSKIGRDPPVPCWTREPVNPIDFVGRN